MEFGAFVNFLGKQDGLVHISELADKRVAKVTDVVKEGDDFSVLSDILGDEDHLGDMDFKVAGTKDGITSLQMDIKITGITFEIMEQALKQAKDGRIHILGEMNKALSESRADVGQHLSLIHI